MKKLAIATLLLLCSAPMASANVYYAYPPTVYVQPNPGYQAGQALGNLLSALIQSSKEKSAQAKQQKLIEDIRSNMRSVAQSETKFMKSMIEQGRGVELLNGIEKFIYSTEMSTPIKDNSNGIISISYLKDIGNNVRMFREYAINTNTNQCRCVIKVAPYDIQESSIENLVNPQKVQQQQNDTQALGKYLGIVFSTQQTPDGGYQVTKVIPNGRAYAAGFQEGDILTKVDTYKLKDHSLGEIASYVASRQQQKAKVSGIVQRSGMDFLVEIQF